MCGLTPHPGQVTGSCVVGGWLCCLIVRTVPAMWSLISLRCFLATSCALHRVMAASSVRSSCFSSCSTVSISVFPLMIWSCMFFCVHRSEQKLHVLANLQRVTKKSLKLIPSCCMWQCRLCRSTDSLIWPSIWRLIAVVINR